MKKNLVAVVITFDKKTNDKIIDSWEILKKKFNVKFISSRSPKPHLTIKSGFVGNIPYFLNQIKKKKFKKLKLNSLGFGVFANKHPLLYIRWEQNKKLLKLYNSIDKICSANFLKKSKNSEYLHWVAKTSIAYKDFNYHNLSKILNNLKKIKLLKNIQAQKIEVMKVDKSGETIIFSNNLI
tara:strand:+ start:397 stop:939 length:543 start_codon:yes stop_codon:yes gene_type:complete